MAEIIRIAVLVDPAAAATRTFILKDTEDDIRLSMSLDGTHV
jgi:hypothetical protein